MLNGYLALILDNSFVGGSKTFNRIHEPLPILHDVLFPQRPNLLLVLPKPVMPTTTLELVLTPTTTVEHPALALGVQVPDATHKLRSIDNPRTRACAQG